jgi:predicted PurR-regulated permease PerM
MERGTKILLNCTLLIIGLYFLFIGLVKAEKFLVPLLTALIMAFLILPLSNLLEDKGIHKILASLASTLVLLLFVIGFLFLVFLQIKSFTDDWDQMQENLEERLEKFSTYLLDNTPLSEDQVSEVEQLSFGSGEESTTEEESGDNSSEVGEQAMSVGGAIFGFLMDFLLTFVYIFLFIHFRRRFKEFVLRFFARNKRRHIAEIVTKTVKVSRNYLAGRLLLMVCLTILYAIGLSISGLDNFFIFSILFAALSIVPFVGNFIGYLIAMAVGLLSGDGDDVLMGVTITFLLTQFIESYILQPLILGDRVDVHPFFIITSVIVGNLVWGVMGMVLAIPIFGMITVVCRQVPELNPFGYLFSMRDTGELETKPHRSQKNPTC